MSGGSAIQRTFLSWQTVSTEKLGDYKVFSVSHNRSRLAGPLDKGEHSFYVLHSSDWVNVIPITEDGQVVMVEQFRHGIGEVTLEIPGGMVDPGDASPAVAAARELFEETGFVSGTWSLLGANHPNPAIQSNVCRTYLATGARQVRHPSFDKGGTELISVRLVPFDEIPVLISNGQITHALVIVAFHLLHLRLSGSACQDSLSGSGSTVP